MSDGFDKEAEREKLRKKFAKDERKRENTQRMSELLLKGATMTNRHCETCSDPIFRHDGREFCPTCNVSTGAEGNADAATDARTDQATSGATDVVNASADVNGTDTRESITTGPAAADRGGSGDRPSADDPIADDPAAAAAAPGTPAGRDAPRTGTGQRSGGGDLTAARESLVRTLTRFSRAAEETDDPRRAREHLRAAREAAEALRALE